MISSFIFVSSSLQRGSSPTNCTKAPGNVSRSKHYHTYAVLFVPVSFLMKRFAFSAFRGAMLPLSFVFFNTFILYYLYPFVFSCIHYFLPWSTVGVHLATVIIAYRIMSSMWRLIVLVCTYVDSRLALEKSGVLVEGYRSWGRLDGGVRSKHDTIPKSTRYSPHL
jgi:hypothetical protein